MAAQTHIETENDKARKHNHAVKKHCAESAKLQQHNI